MFSRQVQELFKVGYGEVYHVQAPSSRERRHFFEDLILNQAAKAPASKKKSSETNCIFFCEEHCWIWHWKQTLDFPQKHPTPWRCFLLLLLLRHVSWPSRRPRNWRYKRKTPSESSASSCGMSQTACPRINASRLLQSLWIWKRW